MQRIASWFRALRRALFGIDDSVLFESATFTTGAFERTGRIFVKGDTVPHLANGHSSYSVLTREGAWVNVSKGAIASHGRKPLHADRVNADGYKWKQK